MKKYFTERKVKVSFTEMFHENVKKMFNWNVMVSGKSSLVNSPIKSPQGKLPPVNYHLGKSPSPPPVNFPPVNSHHLDQG